jgi:pyruvate formate lyase activating enzyme
MLDGAAGLRDVLADLTRHGELEQRLPHGRVRCVACGHRCVIPPGREGVCRVRFNRDGRLRVPFGYVAALQLDPIEKKPFFHALPGARALSFGMLGCDYHCAYCQNWLTSQALRDPAAQGSARRVGPDELVRLALEHGARVMTSTYNEPLITSEWAVAVFREARRAGLLCSYVSNGNATPEVLDYLLPFVQLYKVDLKGFRDGAYRQLGGTLERVLWTIRALHERRCWVEVVTLCVPGLNDSDAELGDIAAFLASVSPDVPWHVTAFHPDYRLTSGTRTTAQTLLRAVELGRATGLHFVYTGNLPGATGRWEDTRCPSCEATLIERRGFRVLRNDLTPGGRCGRCGRAIPGVWE